MISLISLVKAVGEVRYAEGRAEGRAEGLAEVREEMQAETREAMREKYLALFKSLTEELGLSQEAAVKFLKLPKEEEENLLEDLQAEEKQKTFSGIAGYVEAHKQETQQSMQDEEEVER